MKGYNYEFPEEEVGATRLKKDKESNQQQDKITLLILVLYFIWDIISCTHSQQYDVGLSKMWYTPKEKMLIGTNTTICWNWRFATSCSDNSICAMVKACQCRIDGVQSIQSSIPKWWKLMPSSKLKQLLKWMNMADLQLIDALKMVIFHFANRLRVDQQLLGIDPNGKKKTHHPPGCSMTSHAS